MQALYLLGSFFVFKSNRFVVSNKLSPEFQTGISYSCFDNMTSAWTLFGRQFTSSMKWDLVRIQTHPRLENSRFHPTSTRAWSVCYSDLRTRLLVSKHAYPIIQSEQQEIRSVKIV